MALLTRLLNLTWLTRQAGGLATDGPALGAPTEFRTLDGIYFLTADGVYFGVPE